MAENEACGPKKANYALAASDLKPWPKFIQDRMDLWDKLMVDYQAEIAAKDPTPIKITLPDGKQFDAQAWRTKPIEIAENISKGLADNAIIAKVNGEVWDLDRPFEGDATLQVLKFDDDEAKQVFWHSSAHVMGEAMERYCGGHLCYGPPISEGFYYDMFLQEKTISQEDFPKLEELIKCAVKDKQNFERLEVSKENLLKMFGYNEFKVRILNEKVKTPTTTVYRCGPLIDLCRGPHVRHTGKIKAVQVTKASASYWEGNNNAESLQRVYGISFPDPKQLKEWQKFQEEAAKRDHRKLGREQELFFFHPLSPGSAFWFPKGAHIYNKLQDFIRKQYRKHGFTEVITPNMYNSKLWETSGHWQHYAEDMFRLEVEKEQFGLKPMNCPGHCLMFDHQPHTYNELPIRFADFGVLHRNEKSGALTGLTRVRRFQQDDAHIFCRKDQIGKEIKECLEFLKFCYKEVFGFTFTLNLSTRPEGFLGEIETWDQAEAALKNALNESGEDWKLNPGDGAFYGPKIDITIQDALKRNHQCATIQLDFQLPQRFNLHYLDKHQEKQVPVMIHRAVLGSIERMAAILTENFAGKWPLWLSPRQVKIIAVHQSCNDYAKEVKDKIFKAGFEVEFDMNCPDTLNKQIRNAELAQFNFILVIGAEEKECFEQEQKMIVTVRMRDIDRLSLEGWMKVDDVIAKLRHCCDEYKTDTEIANEFRDILTKSFAGKWPFWLSSRQVKIITVDLSCDDYAKSVEQKFSKAGFEAEYHMKCSVSREELIEETQQEQFNFILVIGDEEKKCRTVHVRMREDDKLWRMGWMKVDDIIAKFRRLCDEKTKTDRETSEVWNEEYIKKKDIKIAKGFRGGYTKDTEIAKKF